MNRRQSTKEISTINPLDTPSSIPGNIHFNDDPETRLRRKGTKLSEVGEKSETMEPSILGDPKAHSYVNSFFNQGLSPGVIGPSSLRRNTAVKSTVYNSMDRFDLLAFNRDKEANEIRSIEKGHREEKA